VRLVVTSSRRDPLELRFSGLFSGRPREPFLVEAMEVRGRGLSLDGSIRGELASQRPVQIEIARQQSLLHFTAEQVAQYPTEIFVPGIGHKASGVGQHADELTQQSHVGKGIELSFHTVLLVIEPPARTELNLARCAPVLEIADHCGDQFVVTGI